VTESGSVLSTAVDPTRPNIARIHDYLLGGKDNFTADRQFGEELLRQQPYLVRNARANRAFMQRVVRFAASSGVTQFLNLGTGLPTGENVHQVAQSAVPGARVVYVDDDPVVATHARALLASAPGVEFIMADLRDPAGIVTQASATLDLTAPVALLCLRVLHFIPDDEEVKAIIAALAGFLAQGSYLAVTHWKYLPSDEGWARLYSGVGYQVARRGEPEIAALLPAGWEIAKPGIVPVIQWRPDEDELAIDEEIRLYGLVARKQ
jgi:O-methyltransferase involved in polyketide biosynthesis